MASTRTDSATRIAQFPAETRDPRAVPFSICIGEQTAPHLQLHVASAIGESSSLPSLIYDLACRQSRTGLGSVNFIKTDAFQVPAEYADRQYIVIK